MGKLTSQAVSKDRLLSQQEIEETLLQGIKGRFSQQKLVVLIPDHTRTLPLPMLFRLLVDALSDAKQLDFIVALGTHPPLSETQLNALVGVTAEERQTQYLHIGLFNHEWDSPTALKQIGVLSKDKVREIAGEQWHPSMDMEIPVNINARIFDYDNLIILGPTFPHEVVGFSGGAKYLFPGISGPEMINTTHWLGALGGVMGTIGQKDTPPRSMIHDAAEMVDVPITLIALVVVGEGLAGMFIGDHLAAWNAAVDLSTQVHIQWCDAPYQRVLSQAPAMYDELWTAAKAAYKLESAVADGGELIIYAPHLDTVSHVHGKYIYEVGYHPIEYFLEQWKKFKDIPLGVLAHSTHVKGAGSFKDGIEKPRIQVTLSSQISAEDCARLNLGYLDPAGIDPSEWENREKEGILYVPKAGETLYKLKR
ncbi:MAG: lactate racemase domain-containing protein [Anaerolineales bacterium]|jgi:nickel-dependent lactate racemase